MLIPYTAFGIGEKAKSSLNEVVIGPMPHQNLASNSVSAALHKMGIKGWAVRHSQSSYRDW